MRKLIFASALCCVSLGFSGMASAESLKLSDCRPLTSANAKACCAAPNLRTVLEGEALCQAQRTQTLVSPPTALGTPPGIPSPPGDTGNPPGTPGTADKGINNGFGNGDQNAPGNSGPNNNAENDVGGRSNPSGSPNSTN